MSSIPPSDTESNVSGFLQYSNKDFKHLYGSMLENMEIINEDMLEVQKNLENLVAKAGPLESQLKALLHKLPNPNFQVMSTMDTE